ncbi:twin-arginine translocase subunit TatB [Rhodobacterales bacterium]|nr:twin-arginine translocase subunit TatB [Rhodobacterales bacterium]
MFDIGWTELMVIACVAIIVVGPKDLPRMLRTLGQTIGKMRRLSREFQSTFNDALREAEKQADIADMKKQVEDAANFDPLGDIKKSIKDEASSRTAVKDPKAPAAGETAGETGEAERVPGEDPPVAKKDPAAPAAHESASADKPATEDVKA